MPYGLRVGKPGRARCGCENGALRDMVGRESFTDMGEVENEAQNPVMNEAALHQAHRFPKQIQLHISKYPAQ